MSPRKRKPTPAMSGDTLDSLATFTVRDLYESERKEIYTSVTHRLSDLKSQRKKVAETLGIKPEEETQISRVIQLYEGDDGILALFQTAAEEEAHAAESVKKGGKDTRQRDIPFDQVPSESTSETRASTDPVGVDAIDSLVKIVQPVAPSDMDWDGFRRNVVEMSGDDRTAIREYAERYHQWVNQTSDPSPAPQIPGHLHTLFTDLSPAYAKALGGREDVVFKTDMERAMAKGKQRRKKKAEEPAVMEADIQSPIDGKTYPAEVDPSWTEPVRTAGEEPVASLSAIAEQDSTASK